MAYFALLWKARTIEKYRQNYEAEKINSIMMSKTLIPKQTLTQRWRLYRYDTQKRISRTFRRWYPEGSSLSNLFLYLRTDQTFPNFVVKSILGFVGGIVLTYLCFMFFVFQLSISLMHATIMSSIIGVLLTLGLAFSYRIRCLVFLLIPQFFSRVGRYTLTCYALVLILTGPATNTLNNSEVLSESMACGQEQIKTSVSHIKTLMDRPLNSLKYSVQTMADKLKEIASKMKTVVLKINRLILSLSQVINTSYLWLNSLATNCNAKLGPPYLRCLHSIREGVNYCKNTFGDSSHCDAENVLRDTCSDEKIGLMTKFFEHLNANPVPVIKKRLKNFTERIKHMFFMQIHVHHSYSFSSNTTRTASQVAAGIVTEIRKRADPLLTWLSWSSYVTSFFLLLIIFRAKNYQHMFETRSRYDNRYITKDIRVLDLKRLRERRETILPLNRREQEKYVTTTSFRLVASEKAYLNRSIVFMSITTFKLMIHMIADYSLYWVLMTIRHHGRLQTPVQLGAPDTDIHVSGSGFTADLVKSIVVSLGVLLESPVISPVSCLPNPSNPDFKRYTQIGVLIFLLWFFSMFEPYGLRLRHVVMGHYQPDRAKTRAVWLYNHILRARAGFMKLARRKLHKTYKYRSEKHLTIHQWLLDHIPFGWLRAFLGVVPIEPHCLLCGTVYIKTKPDTQLTRCKSLDCPGIYCDSCFTDIGELCTICLSPEDYGDLSDISLEKGSSDDSDESDNDSEFSKLSESPNLSIFETKETSKRFPKGYRRNIFSRYKKGSEDILPLISKKYNESDDSESLNNNTQSYIFKSAMKKALVVRYKSNSDNLNESLKFKKYYHFDNREVGGLIRMFLKKLQYAKVELDLRDSSFFHQYRDKMTSCFNKKEKPLFHVKNITNKRKNIRSKTTKYPKNLLTSRYSKAPFKSFNTRLNFSQCRCYRISLNIDLYYDKSIKNNRLVTAIKNYYQPTIKCKMKRKGRLLTNLTKKSKHITTNSKNIKFSNSIIRTSRTYDHGKAATLQSNGDKKKNSKTNNGKDAAEEINKTKTSSCYGFEKLVLLFSEYWKHIIATKNIETQTSNNGKISDTIVCKEKKNHKHRKKKTSKIPSDDAQVKSEDVRNEENRNYRLSVFLSDQDWIKRQWVNIRSKVKTDLSVAWNDISEAVVEMTSFPSRKKTNDTEIRSEKEIINIACKLKEEIHQTMNNEIKNQGITIIETNNNVNDVCEKQIACELIKAHSSTYSMEKILKILGKFFEREKRAAAKYVTPDTGDPINSEKCEEFHEPILNSDVIVQRGQIFEPSVLNDVTIYKMPEPSEPCTDNSEENRMVTPSESKPNIRSSKINSTFFKKLCECWKSSKKEDSSLSNDDVGECACFYGRTNETFCCNPAPKKKEVGDKGKFSGKTKSKAPPPPPPKSDKGKFSGKAKKKAPPPPKKCRFPPTKQDLDGDDDEQVTDRCYCGVTSILKSLREVFTNTDENYNTETCDAITNTDAVCGKNGHKDKCSGKAKKEVPPPPKKCRCTPTKQDLDGDDDEQVTGLREVFTNTDENDNKETCDAMTSTDAVCGKNGECNASSMHNVLSIDDFNEDSVDCIVCTCANQNNQTSYKPNIFKYLSSGISSETFSSSRSETVITNQSICYPAALEIRTKFRQRRRIEREDKYAQTIESIGKRNACTNTRDWWSPIVERKELRTSYQQNRRRNEESKEKTIEAKMRRRTDKANETEKFVTFRSRAKIIPSEDILSPYRYLLQSQKYYNELFATKNYPAPRKNPFQQRYIIGHHQTSRQSVGSRQHTRKNYKTKRLVECYSPKKQYNVKKPPVYEWVRGEDWRNARKKFHRSSLKSSNQSK